MRNTKQKELVLDILKKSYNHDSASDIYEKAKEIIPNISLGTIYRILNEFVDSNLVKKIKVTENTEHYDYIRHDHYHFVCTSCNKIHDVNDLKLSNETNLKIEDAVFYGHCNDCIKEGK